VSRAVLEVPAIVGTEVTLTLRMFVPRDGAEPGAYGNRP
jgi:hypothetical protein